MKNSIEKLIAPVLEGDLFPGTTIKRLGRSMADHKHQLISVAGALLFSYMILKIMQDQSYRGKFQLSDYTEG